MYDLQYCTVSWSTLSHACSSPPDARCFEIDAAFIHSFRYGIYKEFSSDSPRKMSLWKKRAVIASSSQICSDAVGQWDCERANDERPPVPSYDIDDEIMTRGDAVSCPRQGRIIDCFHSHTGICGLHVRTSHLTTTSRKNDLFVPPHLLMVGDALCH